MPLSSTSQPSASETLSHLPTESRGNWLRSGGEAPCLGDFAGMTGWYCLLPGALSRSAS